MPKRIAKMSTTLASLYKRGAAFLTPSASSTNLNGGNGFATASEGELFPKVDPAVDGEDCDHDCASCTVHLPAGFKIDETEELYGRVKGWATHILVATGKTDWVRDVADVKGSVMEAVSKCDIQPENGKLMLSASDMPLPAGAESNAYSPGTKPTTVLLLPAFTIVEDVTPQQAADLVRFISTAPTNTSPLPNGLQPKIASTADLLTPPPSTPDSTPGTRPEAAESKALDPAESKALDPAGSSGLDPADSKAPGPADSNGLDPADSNGLNPAISSPLDHAQPAPLGTIDSARQEVSNANASPSISTLTLHTRPAPHRALILLCSQRTRDARCGQSAPLLRREFERHLRTYNLYRDAHDQRPGGVPVLFISHVGGHKFSANVMVYRRARHGDAWGQAEQCIWLARVRPEDCEGIVRFTVLQGKVVQPQRQLRGGFDRQRGLVSW